MITLCPIALVASCAKCPVVRICPLKGVIGDYKKPGTPVAVATPPAPAATDKPKKRVRTVAAKAKPGARRPATGGTTRPGKGKR